MSYEKMAEERTGTNWAYVSTFLSWLYKKEKKRFKHINRNLSLLKTLRTNADYNERLMSYTDSQKAIDIKNKLKTDLQEIKLYE